MKNVLMAPGAKAVKHREHDQHQRQRDEHLNEAEGAAARPWIPHSLPRAVRQAFGNFHSLTLSKTPGFGNAFAPWSEGLEFSHKSTQRTQSREENAPSSIVNNSPLTLCPPASACNQ